MPARNDDGGALKGEKNNQGKRRVGLFTTAPSSCPAQKADPAEIHVPYDGTYIRGHKGPGPQALAARAMPAWIGPKVATWTLGTCLTRAFHQ